MGFGDRCRIDGRRYPRLVLSTSNTRKFPTHVSDGLIYTHFYLLHFLLFCYNALPLLELRPKRILPPIPNVPPRHDPPSPGIKPNPRPAPRIPHPLLFFLSILLLVVVRTSEVPQFLDVLLEQVRAQSCVVLRDGMRAVRVVRETYTASVGDYTLCTISSEVSIIAKDEAGGKRPHLKDFPSRIPIPPSLSKTRGTKFEHSPIRYHLFHVPHHCLPYARKALGVGEWDVRGVETTEVKVAYYGWLDPGEEGMLGGEVGEEV